MVLPEGLGRHGDGLVEVGQDVVFHEWLRSYGNRLVSGRQDLVLLKWFRCDAGEPLDRELLCEVVGGHGDEPVDWSLPCKCFGEMG